jgi:hypothetical protein
VFIAAIAGAITAVLGLLNDKHKQNQGAFIVASVAVIVGIVQLAVSSLGNTFVVTIASIQGALLIIQGLVSIPIACWGFPGSQNGQDGELQLMKLGTSVNFKLKDECDVDEDEEPAESTLDHSFDEKDDPV